jgi:hypothetical protein
MDDEREITERLPRLDYEDWDDGIEPELELPLGELPTIIVDWDKAA